MRNRLLLTARRFHHESTSAKHYAYDKRLEGYSFYISVQILTEKAIKTAGQNTLVWVNINRSSSLFLLDPCAWKQWVVEHFISRKQVRLPVHIVSIIAIYFSGVPRQVYVIEWGLIGKNNRKDTFQFLMFLRNAPHTGSAVWPQWIPIALGVGQGDVQCSAVKSSHQPFSLASLSLVFCILPSSPSPLCLRWLSI